MSVLALANKAISSLGGRSPDLARLFRRVARGPQVLLQRDYLVPVGTLDPTDYSVSNAFQLPGVTPAETTVLITGVFVTVVDPSPAGAYNVLVGTTLGGAELLLSQAFANPQTRGDTRGVLVAELGASLAAAANYRGLFAGTVDIFTRVDPTVIATGGKIRLTITGHPLLP